MESIIYGDNVNPAAFNLISSFLSNSVGQPFNFLEFGCSTGALGHKILSTYNDIKWVGVDFNASSLSIASSRLTSVYEADLNYIDNRQISEWGNPDYIVMVDVLEHVHEPNLFLARIRKAFPKSRIVCVLPNISCFQAFDQISKNDFAHQESRAPSRGAFRGTVFARIRSAWLRFA